MKITLEFEEYEIENILRSFRDANESEPRNNFWDVGRVKREKQLRFTHNSILRQIANNPDASKLNEKVEKDFWLKHL